MPSINYIELINRAWMMREQGLLTVRDHDLYNYLLHKSNSLKWQNPFKQSSEIICVILGINGNTLMQRRKHLQELGLIKFTEGVSRSCPAEYELCVPDSASRTKSRTNNKGFVKPSLDEVREGIEIQTMVRTAFRFAGSRTDSQGTLRLRCDE